MQSDGISEAAKADRKWQRTVLGLLLIEDPRQLTYKELERELVGESPEFEERDAVARAVDELTRAGVLRRCEAMVLLTQTTRHLASLEDD